MKETGPSIKAMEECSESLFRYSGLLVSFHSRFSSRIREHVIRNLVYRGLTLHQSIWQLWHIKHFQDCWALFRCQLDRLLHLHSMAAKNEFEAFEQFSFVKQFEANHAAASSEQFRSSIDLGDFRSTEANKRRYRSLKQSGAKWFRPKAEAAAKSLEMPFLYTFGYDYSSCHIHPMANDGQDYLFEFQGVENFHPSTVNLIIQNSILVQVLLIQEGLNASELRWRKIVYDFLDECLHALAGREQKHQDILSKLVAAGPDFDWGALPRDGERHG